METGRRVDLWAEELRDRPDAFRAELPAGLSLKLTFDQSEYTGKRLAGVAQNLLIGVALVVGVLLITLGWRA
jgi:multidrug efflux pump subunit AcrB